MLLFEHFHTARESLRRTRTRTLLTISGVAIGIASITSILALSGGIVDILSRQVNQIGASTAIVRPLQDASRLIDLTNPTPTNAFSTSPITEQDVGTLKEISGVDSATPLMTLSGSVRSRDERPKYSTILATTPEFTKTTRFTVESGQFIDATSQPDVAVIGKQLAIDLFGTDQAIGKRFFIRGQEFTAIGVLKRQNDPVNINNVDLDRAAIITLESGKLFNGGVAQIQQINIETKPDVSINTLKHSLQKALEKSHDGEQDTSVLTGSDITVPNNRFLGFINTTMVFIAGISLLVGGIGIMNIMLVGVAERTREIGLRKAVGASNASIVLQFLIEALIISMIGGFIGYVGGYTIAFFISLLLPYDPAFHWQIAACAFCLSLIVGVLFGTYPAVKAARKNPIESLRRHH